MKNTHLILILGALNVGLYAGILRFGLGLSHLSTWWSMPTAPAGTLPWQPPALDAIPADAHGDLILEGRRIFLATPQFASDHARAQISCSNCHEAGGIRRFASPMVGLNKIYPTYNQRAGRVISLAQRIQECFIRSENGTPPDLQSEDIRALLAYIDWVSTPDPNRRQFVGRGLVAIPVRIPNPAHGQQIYAAHCAGCHGENGLGYPPQFPPLWGPDAYNDGAGMNKLPKMAAFVYANMPQNRRGVLSLQDAWDVSAWVRDHPRPALNPAYSKY